MKKNILMLAVLSLFIGQEARGMDRRSKKVSETKRTAAGVSATVSLSPAQMTMETKKADKARKEMEDKARKEAEDRARKKSEETQRQIRLVREERRHRETEMSKFSHIKTKTILALDDLKSFIETSPMQVDHSPEYERAKRELNTMHREGYLDRQVAQDYISQLTTYDTSGKVNALALLGLMHKDISGLRNPKIQ